MKIKSLPLFRVGTAKRYRTKAIQTSKHCNIICMYTAFTTTDRSPTKSISDRVKAQETGEHIFEGLRLLQIKTTATGLRKPDTTASSSSLKVYFRNKKPIAASILNWQISAHIKKLRQPLLTGSKTSSLCSSNVKEEVISSGSVCTTCRDAKNPIQKIFYWGYLVKMPCLVVHMQ